ncbi:peptidase C39 family protein [Streptomyces sp. HNM0574]|nr:peptidase C39 family protein [Streptomyces sp. HNM0574]
MSSRPAKRRSVLAAAVAVAAGAVATSGTPVRAASAQPGRSAPGTRAASTVGHRAWTAHRDWLTGTHEGTRAVQGGRPGVVIEEPHGTYAYKDPHTGREQTWEYARWTSPEHSPEAPASEAIVSWNAHTPRGTWIRAEIRATYSDGGTSPWYTMGIWTSGDGDDVPRRTSVDKQKDGSTSVSTDTLAVDDRATGLRVTAYRLRVTLYRARGSDTGPTVWRLGAMTSDVPDRFEVPASEPGRAAELKVPRYSQEIHKGQYPEYDGGGEAWCSPTSSQMILEFWGRKPTAEDLEWVNPDYADPQVCHAARYTFDYQYEGCGNWPFNTAYATTYRDMQAAVTRLDDLGQAERLIAAGIPLITSQSFIESELDGAGYGTPGHLMTVVGFTPDGDIVANDPAAPDNPSVRRVYKRRQWENIWLRTKRKDADGKTTSATGGVCYLYFPLDLSDEQREVLGELGVL